MSQRLTTKEKWEDVWADTRIPQILKPSPDLRRQLKRFLPKEGGKFLCEVGCAPGRWMAWFGKSFGYEVEGIEYAENAAEITKRNLELQQVPGRVLVKDFFAADITQHRYDIVFSCGFIEHFDDVSSVVKRHSLMANEYVVLIVPNLYGINGFISKTIRAQVYAEHNPIDRHQLKSFGEDSGLKTLFCDYVGGITFIMPASGRQFFKEHPLVSKALNAPINVFNKVSTLASGSLRITPRWRSCSTSLMYIGTKTFESQAKAKQEPVSEMVAPHG